RAREPLCPTHVGEETGAKQTNLTTPVRVLRAAGVGESEPGGRFTYYRLRPEVLEGLAGQFTALAASARTHADRKRPCP
ncbi:helix-turn-helix domain-containing protein, partial [Streptomyces sp. DSM 44917]